MPDRLPALLASTTLNGIDFVEITRADQTGLRVHFLNTVPVAGSLDPIDPVTITGGETVPRVPVLPIDVDAWSLDDHGRPMLTLRTPVRGDFSDYRLHIDSDRLDPYYATVTFTFKAGCPSTLDCLTIPTCDRPPETGPVIDYLAKDFTSFRAALLDYSAIAYPHWQERDESDLGMVLAELLSAAGDELSYLQDRVAAEATLATATQRSSVVRLARLVDYEPRPAVSARTLVQIDVGGGPVPAGLVVEAALPDGGRVAFELGDGLVDHRTGELRTAVLATDPRWNRLDHSVAGRPPRIVPYLWDDEQRCLPAGATGMWVAGHGFGFPTGDPQLGTEGIALLIDTAAVTAADPPVREIVRLTGAVEEHDPLYGVAVTRLTWAEPLAAEHALNRTVLAGNLVPASQGSRHSESFVIDGPPGTADAAVARAGPDAGCGDAVTVYLHTLTTGRLAWLDLTGGIVPEISVQRRPAGPGQTPQTWLWRRSLLDADAFEAAFTVEPSAYRRLLPATVGGSPQWEYDGDEGDSIRFGTGPFGDRPPEDAVFDVHYRVTAGAAGNVAAGAVSLVPPALAGVLLAATNPFAATGGADEESLDEVRRAAPQDFRSHQFRAVRVEDHTATALEPNWAIDAGATVRWTGSWPTVFTTAVSAAAAGTTVEQQRELIELLDRRRLAGVEVVTPEPRYLGLDLVVTVCAQPGALRGEVEAAVLTELSTGRRRDGAPGFFAPGRRRFGAPLHRSALEAAVQAAAGVRGVLEVTYRRRGVLPDLVPMPDTVTVNRDEIIRVDNDPSRPDRGSLRIVVRGGT